MQLYKQTRNKLDDYIHAYGMRDFRQRATDCSEVAIEKMDKVIKFMGSREYKSANPAMAAVRLPIICGFWMMMMLTIVIVFWGMIAPIESAAIASGNVVLLSNKKTIQHLEGGIIEKILVKDGDTVKNGQELLSLKNVAAIANRDMLKLQLYAQMAAEKRLLAERDKFEKVSFDPKMLEESKINADIAKVIESQERLFESEGISRKAKVDGLNQQILSAQEQIQGMEAQIKATKTQMQMLDEELVGVQQLFTKGYATKPRLLGLQRNREELDGKVGQYEAEIAKTRQNITETNINILNTKTEFETKISEEMRDSQSHMAELKERLRAAEDMLKRTVITAPADGVVNGLKYHTAGGVVEAGAPIMDVIPQNDQLIIEAKLSPNDIDTVHSGLESQVMFTAYSARNTPKVPGKVTQVSADKFETPGAIGQSYYTARVEVDKKFLQKMANHIELYPGMPAEVLIRTGSRSFFAYLFKPMTDSMHKAFREE